MLIRSLLLSVSLLLAGCGANSAIKTGNVVEPVDPNNCAIRVMHLEIDASALGNFSGRADGTQLTFMNVAACPGMNIELPAPRDSSKTIEIKIPGAGVD